MIIAARDVVVVVVPARPANKPPHHPQPQPQPHPSPAVAALSACSTRRKRFPTSALPCSPRKRFDFRPRRRRAKSFPRICVIGVSEPRPIPEIRNPTPDDEIDATRLRRRLAGLKRALDDLDGQAKRLARWRAKRDLGLNRSKYFSPMRPGWPPGRRKRAFHEVDDILRECHALALILERSDTS